MMEQKNYNGCMFQSTRPVRGATQIAAQLKGALVGFNPRAPCGARQITRLYNYCATVVSIHAPRAGRDLWIVVIVVLITCFNPRAPCGARPEMLISNRSISGFNPRAPCGARQKFGQNADRVTACFNPRAPCGARLIRLRRGLKPFKVSIHAPRAGRDLLLLE